MAKKDDGGAGRGPSLALDTLIVEVPVLDEEALVRLERKLTALLGTASEVRSEARRLLRTVQAALAKHAAPDHPPGSPGARLQLVPPEDKPTKPPTKSRTRGTT